MHAFQGRTVDNVIAAIEANHPNLTNQKMLYVGISRDRAKLVTDDKAGLKEQLEALGGERAGASEAGTGRDRGASRDGPQMGTGPAKEAEKTPQPKSADRDLGLLSMSRIIRGGRAASGDSDDGHENSDQGDGECRKEIPFLALASLAHAFASTLFRCSVSLSISALNADSFRGLPRSASAMAWARALSHRCAPSRSPTSHMWWKSEADADEAARRFASVIDGNVSPRA